MPFDSVPPDVDETPLGHEAPAVLVARLACAKADAFVLDGTSPKIQGPKPATLEQGELRYELAPVSAALLVCKK